MKKVETLEDMRIERTRNFKKLGQYLLQKIYYEESINDLLNIQRKLCEEIIKKERGLK